mgnify:FL=1
MKKILFIIISGMLYISCQNIPNPTDYSHAESTMLNLIASQYGVYYGKYKYIINVEKFSHPKFVRIPKDLQCNKDIMRVHGIMNCFILDANNETIVEEAQYYFYVLPYHVSLKNLFGNIVVYRSKYEKIRVEDENNTEYNVSPNQIPVGYYTPNFIGVYNSDYNEFDNLEYKIIKVLYPVAIEIKCSGFLDMFHYEGFDWSVIK